MTVSCGDIDDIEGMTAAMHEDGCALIPGVLSMEEVQACRDAIDRLRSELPQHARNADVRILEPGMSFDLPTEGI